MSPDTNDEGLSEPVSASGVTRSEFLARAGTGALGVTAGGVLLSACGGSSSSSGSGTTSATATTSQGQPAKGGLLTVAMTGSGNSETLNPAIVTAPIDSLRLYALFDPLVRPVPNFQTAPGLALQWEPNADATVYQITLREGVTWHDGKPFTADDVIYTWNLMKSPAHFGHGSVTNIKLDQIKKAGPTKMIVPLKVPNARLQDLFIFNNSSVVVQAGTTSYSKPVGTGPYVLDSFVPGTRATFHRNPNYWESPLPYPDELHVISVDDPVARVNGLESGEFNVIDTIPYEQVASLQGNSAMKLLEDQSGPNQVIYFRLDRPPFSDPRVTLAMKLIADRPALISSVFSGHANVLNYNFGKGLPQYDSTLAQRVQDLEQAKSLLKQAGQSDLRATLYTSPVIPGLVEAATVYAQQAQAAGVTLKIQSVPASNYFDPAQGYLSFTLAQDTWPVASLQDIFSKTLLTTSPENETHFGSAQSDAMYYKAQGELDPAKAQDLWNQVQQVQYNQGGNLIWAAKHQVGGFSPKVGGYQPGWLYPLGNFNVWNWWIS